MTADAERVREALAWLERHGTKRTREEMLTRYELFLRSLGAAGDGETQSGAE